MKPRSLAILAVVVLGLLAFIWFFERDLPSTDERRERAERALSLEADEVVAIEIERGDQTLRLERDLPAEGAAEGGAEGEGGGDEGVWRMAAPLTARADGSRVDALLDSLVELSRERTLEDFDPDEVGLAQPRARVRLRSSGGGEQTLLVGAEVPAAHRMIVQREGSPEALVVGTAIWDDLERGTDEWRDRSVFTADRDDVESIDLRGPLGELRLGKRGDVWWVEAPIEDRAAKQRVNSLLGAVDGLEAKTFVAAGSEPEEGLGLDPAWATLELGLGDGRQPFRLEIGAVAGDGDGNGDGTVRYGRAEGQLFTFDAGLDGAVERATADWQSRDWSSLEVWEIDRLSAIRDGETTLFERSGGDWQRGGEKVPYSAVSDLLYGIDGLEPTGLAPVPEDGTETAVFELGAAGRSERLALRASGGVTFGTVEGRPYALRLPADGVSKLLAELESARTAVESPPAAEDTEDAAEAVSESADG